LGPSESSPWSSEGYHEQWRLFLKLWRVILGKRRLTLELLKFILK
jgi:hypothetical protein